MNRIVCIVLCSVFIACLAACRSSGVAGNGGASEAAMPKTILVRFVTTAGDIVVELDREHAPISVDNFLMYVDRGEYDGTIFHRVIPTFVIQGGGSTGTTDGAGEHLIDRGVLAKTLGRPDKPIRNEWQNGLKNVRGTIAMARDEAPDTATREFYINVVDNAKLDTAREKTGYAGYAVFGKVVAGMEVVDAIKAGETKAIPEKDMQDVPVKPVVVLSARRVR